jgi:hypothetical protein
VRLAASDEGAGGRSCFFLTWFLREEDLAGKIVAVQSNCILPIAHHGTPPPVPIEVRPDVGTALAAGPAHKPRLAWRLREWCRGQLCLSLILAGRPSGEGKISEKRMLVSQSNPDGERTKREATMFKRAGQSLPVITILAFDVRGRQSWQ